MLAAIGTVLICLVGAGFGFGIWWLFRPNPSDPLRSSYSSDTDSPSGDSGSSGGDGD